MILSRKKKIEIATQLCDRIKLTTYQTDKAASEQELSTNDYLLKITGWKVGEGKRPKYYPVVQID